jgi:hypothetical protein
MDVSGIVLHRSRRSLEIVQRGRDFSDPDSPVGAR